MHTDGEIRLEAENFLPVSQATAMDTADFLVAAVSAPFPQQVRAMDKQQKGGPLGGSGVELLPSAQGVTPGSRDQVPRQAPPAAGSLLPPPPGSRPLSVSGSLMSK